MECNVTDYCQGSAEDSINVQAVTGPLSSCAGHEAVCETAMRVFFFTFIDTKVIQDTSNAVNRQAAIQAVGPAISTILSNKYQAPIK